MTYNNVKYDILTALQAQERGYFTLKEYNAHVRNCLAKNELPNICNIVYANGSYLGIKKMGETIFEFFDRHQIK